MLDVPRRVEDFALTSGSKHLKGLPQQQQQGMLSAASRRTTRVDGDYTSPLGGRAELAIPCVLAAWPSNKPDAALLQLRVANSRRARRRNGRLKKKSGVIKTKK